MFASLAKETHAGIKILVGLFSVAAAVLTALQTFLKYSELSDKHRIAGGKFANLKHRIELLSSLTLPPQDELKQQLTMIEDRWAKVREESPNLPQGIWKRFETAANNDETNPDHPDWPERHFRSIVR